MPVLVRGLLFVWGLKLFKVVDKKLIVDGGDDHAGQQMAQAGEDIVYGEGLVYGVVKAEVRIAGVGADV